LNLLQGSDLDISQLVKLYANVVVWLEFCGLSVWLQKLSKPHSQSLKATNTCYALSYELRAADGNRLLIVKVFIRKIVGKKPESMSCVILFGV